MRNCASFSWCWILPFILSSVSNGGGDTITQSETIKDGQTLVSAGGTFELGFFKPGTSRNRYLGIWFAATKDVVVWVANRGEPLTDATGVLRIDASGNLLLTDSSNETIWSSGLSNAGTTVARLLDTGNLVLSGGGGSSSSGNGASLIWQSFHYPSDTLLPGMKLVQDFRTRINRTLTSWRNSDDPAVGRFTLKLDPRGLPQLFSWDEGSAKYRSGPWNGLRLSGVPEMNSYDMFNFTFQVTKEEADYGFDVTKPSMFARVQITADGLIERLVMYNKSSWSTFWFGPKDQCDNYAFCGPYGVCDINKSPYCSCLPGFQPRNPDEWYVRIGKGGCVRKTKLNCTSGDGFLLVPEVKLPDTVNSTVNMTMSLAECREMCSNNCACTAYASANISGGDSGCVIWVGDIIDIRAFTSEGQDLYLRLASSEIASILRSSPKRRNGRIIVSVTAPFGLLLLRGLCAYCWLKKRKKKLQTMEGGTRQDKSDRSFRREDPDIHLFDFNTIASATNNFSDENIIGEGGFGVVYKGNLADGQELAVKRLSIHSVNGVDGFKNEVTLIAKLQHRNLVRLLGCCIAGDEWMLIYEYMPNKSLDAFIFDDGKRLLLDWRKRLDIILGVARGLLYLHQDSRLRIVHRDLKAGNILLDKDMNPKISDFGTARIFGGDQMEVTRRVVGTFGYMSPEYAMDGVFSVKSDVFSFGVMTLEIISGRKNRWISQTDSCLNLLAHAWSLWKEGNSLELLDNTPSSPCPLSEVLRCMQVGLLCVQGSPNDRPTMQQVVLMLVNENSTLPQPKQPGFFILSNPMAVDQSSSGRHKSCVDVWSLNSHMLALAYEDRPVRSGRRSQGGSAPCGRFKGQRLQKEKFC